MQWKLILFLCLVTPPLIGHAEQICPPVHNLEAEAREAYDRLEKSADLAGSEEARLVEHLRNYRVLFLSGIFTSDSNFIPHVQWMRERTIDAALVPTITEGTPEQNVNIILRTLNERESPKKPILFITHSRGGSDVLELLLKHPALWRGENGSRPAVAAWLSISSAFGGSLIAERIKDRHPFLGGLTSWYLSGDTGTAPRLSITHSQAYLWKYHLEIQELVNAPGLKIITFASWIDPNHSHQTNPRLQQLHDRLKFWKLEEDWYPHDGFVAVPATRLPCTNRIELGGIDHWDLPVPNNNPDFDSILAVNAMLYVLFFSPFSTK